jgi:crossover junction endodeoxyribonuclease RusA
MKRQTPEGAVVPDIWIASCFVPGIPQPQGSMSRSRTGHTYHGNKKLMPWRRKVAEDVALSIRWSGLDIIRRPHGAVVEITAYFERPKSVRAGKRPMHTVKPDPDKLLRAVLDALTGIAYEDDAQVIQATVCKEYRVGEPGVRIDIRRVAAR